MSNLTQYDQAVVKYHKTLQIKYRPVISSNFQYEFRSELKHSFQDYKQLEAMRIQYKWQLSLDWDFEYRANREVVLITNTNLTIAFASHNLVEMNGYEPQEVVGKNPKIFQGIATDPFTSSQIKNAIELQLPFDKKIINYKKNGDSYNCHIKGFPVFNIFGLLSHYIAFEKLA